MNDDTKKQINERYQRELDRGEFFWPDSIFGNTVLTTRRYCFDMHF